MRFVCVLWWWFLCRKSAAKDLKRGWTGQQCGSLTRTLTALREPEMHQEINGGSSAVQPTALHPHSATNIKRTGRFLGLHQAKNCLFPPFSQFFEILRYRAYHASSFFGQKGMNSFHNSIPYDSSNWFQSFLWIKLSLSMNQWGLREGHEIAPLFAIFVAH